MNSPIIQCISVSKYFNGKNQVTKAVDDVSFEVKRNEFVLIKGRSGAGKSTLLNLLSGLDKPTNGSVVIENERIDRMSNPVLSKLLSEKIGIIFQNFNLLPTYTVFENIEIALASDNPDDSKNIMLLLKQLGLSEKAGSLPTELSIGQQQKVAIARTLAKRSEIIFADEPTGSVDDETASEIIQHLLFLKKEHNATIVMASHGSTLDKYADRIITMQNGKMNS
jgi:putative ABC transport system ATP-binding protein